MVKRRRVETVPLAAVEAMPDKAWAHLEPILSATSPKAPRLDVLEWMREKRWWSAESNPASRKRCVPWPSSTSRLIDPGTSKPGNQTHRNPPRAGSAISQPPPQNFIYNLWGDTVNLAFCMELPGLTGTIQMTRQVINGLAGFYLFVSREPPEIKGKGTSGNLDTALRMIPTPFKPEPEAEDAVIPD